MSLLLTDNASAGSSDGMIPEFLVEEGGGMEKIGNCSDITYFTYWESGPKHVTVCLQRCWHIYNRSCWRVFFSNLGRKCIISEERFVLEFSTSRAMLVTAGPSCLNFRTVVRWMLQLFSFQGMAINLLTNVLVPCDLFISTFIMCVLLLLLLLLLPLAVYIIDINILGH